MPTPITTNVDLDRAQLSIRRTCDDPSTLMDEYNSLARYMGWELIDIEEACDRVDLIQGAIRVIGATSKSVNGK